MIVGIWWILNLFTLHPSFSPLFILFEYYQLLLMLALLNGDLSVNGFYFLKAFKFFKFDLFEILHLFGVNSIANSMSYTNQTNLKFKNLGYESRLTVLNYAVLDGAFMLLFFSHIMTRFIFTAMDIYKNLKTHDLNRLWKKNYKGSWGIRVASAIRNFYKKNVYLIWFMEIYFFLLLNVLNELSSHVSGETLSMMSLLFAILLLLTLLLWAIYLSYVVYRRVHGPLDTPYRSLFKDLKLENRGKFYYIFFLLRRTLICFFIIFIKDTSLQYGFILLTNWINFGYIWIARPYQSILNNIVHALTDVWVVGNLIAYSTLMANGEYTCKLFLKSNIFTICFRHQ